MKLKLPINNPLPEIEPTINAILKAGKSVMKIYNEDFTLSFKKDHEPITEADIKSNEIIQKSISEFGYPILSEESIDNMKRLEYEKIWIVDPLDGTSDFVKKTGEFTIMIGLVINQIPELGIIYWPTQNLLYLAQKSHGAYQFNGTTWSRMHVSSLSRLEECNAVGSRFHRSDKERVLLEQFKITKFTSRGSSLKAIDIGLGNAELYFTASDKIKQWDTCASHCLVTESGGKITDMLGNELIYNTKILNHKNGILITNGLIHDAILDIYRDFSKNNQ